MLLTGLVRASKGAEGPQPALGRVNTIYLGGGTPSLLDPTDLASIVAAIRRFFSQRGVGSREVTLEADPETITAEKAVAWSTAGINRISLGAQSFHDNELIAAGRMHRREDIFRAVDLLRAAGITNVSLDLIAGLPHQTPASWSDSLGELRRIRPEHISIYLLEIDDGSRLGRESLAGGSRYGAAAIPDDDAMATFYERACAKLAAAGYEHYEISNWALPGFRSRHNLIQWRRRRRISVLERGRTRSMGDGAGRTRTIRPPTLRPSNRGSCRPSSARKLTACASA